MMHISVLLFLSNLFSSDGILIVIVALLVFGGEKLPELARGLGKGIRDFKDASEGVKREINSQIYSYEEKKADKKVEEAIIAAQAPNANASPAAEIRPPVENTRPYNDGSVTVPESHGDIPSELVTDGHVTAPHTDPERPVV
jgi:sec-independent protein translocase protein TatA